MTAERFTCTRHLRTYASKANAKKAVEKAGFESLPHVFALSDCGRVFPVFIGERCAQAGTHFHFPTTN